MARVRDYVFTLNNYDENDENIIFSLQHECKYIVVGKEVGESGTPHFQGFICFQDAKTFSAIQKLLPDGCHIEARKGTFQQAADYCKKDGDYFESGTIPMDQKAKGEAGKLSSEERWALAKAGNFEKLPPEHYQRYRAIHAEFTPVSDRSELKNLWICGPSGCGKSKHVRDNYPSFYSKGMSKWWDGYRHEEVVLLDDFDPTHGKYLSYYLKIWADHYAFNAEVKGGMLKIRPKLLIVTSQYPIEACFEEAETVSAISRRFEVLQLATFPNMLINN